MYYLEEKVHAAWPYVVLFAAMLSHAAGLGFSYGVMGMFTIAQRDHFKISMLDSSWTAAVHYASMILLLPAAALLTKMLSLRTMQITGSCVVMLGISCCAFAGSPSEVRFLFGFVTGFGMVLVRTASTAILLYHFNEEWIQFAQASLVFGSSCGLAAFPIISYHIFVKDHFIRSMLYIAPIMAVHILCGLVYSQPTNMDLVFERAQYLKEEKSLSLDEHFQPSSIKNVVTNLRVLAHLVSGFYQVFGMTAFFTLLVGYIAKDPDTHINLEVACQGSIGLGCAAVVGVVATAVTQHIEYDRLVMQILTPMICGSVVFLLTRVQNEISYSMLMALFGLVHGLQVPNYMGISSTLPADERMIFYILQLIVESAAGFCGPPMASLVQDMLGLRVGIYCSAASTINAGLCLIPILIYESIKRCQCAKAKDTHVESTIHIEGCHLNHMKYKRVLQQDADQMSLNSSDDEQH